MLDEANVRPWGSFINLYEGHRHKVKRLIITPGCQTSLQSHRYRREVWTITAGAALLAIDGKHYSGLEGQTFHVNFGAVHRITNPGLSDLEIIEVQIGPHCIEDDIERYEDDYGRDVVELTQKRLSQMRDAPPLPGYIPPL